VVDVIVVMLREEGGLWGCCVCVCVCSLDLYPVFHKCLRLCLCHVNSKFVILDEQISWLE
jgi:hypothetical protein